MSVSLKHLAVAASVLFVLSGCGKENFTSNSLLSSSSKLISSCGKEEKETTVMGILQKSSNQESIRLNTALYHYAQAFNSLMQRSEMRSIVADVLKNSSVDALSFESLGSENETFKMAFEQALQESMAETGVYAQLKSNQNSHEFLLSELSYSGVNYKPVVRLFNKTQQAEGSGNVVVLIGQNVNACDDVAGWRGNTPILMGEREANNTQDLVLIVDPGQTSPVYVDENALEPTMSTNRTSGVDLNIQVASHSIKSAASGFEDNSDHEVRKWVKITSNIGNAEEIEDFRDVDNDDVQNSTFFNADEFWAWIGQSVYAHSSSRVFFGTYEHDWYASKKDIASTCNSSVKVSVRMTFSGQFYFRACGFQPFGNPTPNGGSNTQQANNLSEFNFYATWQNH